MSVELGQVIYTAVKPIFKIYFIIAIGFYLAKRNVLNVATCRDISDTVVTAVLPCLVFRNIVENLQSSDIKNIGIIFFTSIVLFGLGALLAYLTYIFTGSPKRWFGGLLSVGIFPNIADLPIAYIQTFTNGGMIFNAEEGDKGVAYVCIFLAAQVFFQFSFGLYELIEWDFRDELKDEEKDLESDETKEKNDSNDDSGHEPEVQTLQVPSPEVPGDNATISTNDNTSIASSLPSNMNQELPLPTDLGASDSNESIRRRSSRRRKDSILSASSKNILQPTRSRDLRTLKSQDVEDIIHEYSEYEQFRDSSLQRIITVGSDAGGNNMIHQPSHTSASSLKSKTEGTKAYLKRRAVTLGKNLISPMSATLIVSIAIAMAPPLKSLFVPAWFHIPDAPDNQPPLSFIIDITSYVGNAAVPLGLLLLGATIARLKISSMPKGFWKTALAIVVFRLILLPIIGVAITTGLQAAGWYEDDKLLRFISVLEFGLPNATSLVYFTAFYLDPNSDDHIQMDCLAAGLIFQYAVLFITLPFLVSFTIKVSLGY